MTLKLACCAAFIVGMGITHFLSKAYRYAKNRWKVPTFSGWEQLFKDNSKL